jgi:AraC-like DNA-binding protein
VGRPHLQVFVVQRTAHRDQIHHWIDPLYPGLELLRATYVSQTFAPHAHEEFALGVMERGAESLLWNGAVHYPSAGEVIAINPGEIHTGNPIQPGGYSYRMTYVGRALIDEILADVRGARSRSAWLRGPIIRDPDAAAQLRILHLVSERSRNSLERQIALISLLRCLFGRHGHDRMYAPDPGQHPGAVRAMRDYLHAHAVDDVTLDELAAVGGLSKFHALRVFRTHTGLTPHQYQTHLRVHLARELIRSGLRLSEVAVRAGFCDQSHLHRHFKRVVGVTPGGYARSWALRQTGQRPAERRARRAAGLG